MKRKTKEEFIKEAKLVHGDRYDYSKVEYKNTKKKVCIICPIHGEFWQTPGAHLIGCGCQKCGGTGKLTQEEFIQKAKDVHGDKYNYSKVQYINSATKVEIICPKHGSFWQTPNSHTSAQNGCPKCKIDDFAEYRRIGLQEFINRATKIHGNKYDYSKVNYIDSKTKVCIICPKHGEFWQIPENHYHYGCIKCGGTYKMDSETFINKAKEIHRNKYSYDKVIYTTTEAKVIIGCPEHGDFEQTPHDHLGGHGCPICGGVFTYTNKSFIEAARKVHGSFYSYDKVEYSKSTEKVIITCPNHGDFKQTPVGHLNGAGCPKCKRSRGEEKVALILDSLGIKYEEQVPLNINSEIRNRIIVDFYIPDNNCIIEFNGAQHYIPMEFFGGIKQLVNQQRRDKELRDYCQSNNIKLIEIPYTTKNIEKVLVQLL